MLADTQICDARFDHTARSAGRPEGLKVDGRTVPRIFSCTNGGDGTIKLGVLPLSQYLNGHTFFVQHVHTLPNAAKPLSVHMTYQFAEGAKFSYGKRQRLREAGLWLIDDDSYFNGKYIKLADAAANTPIVEMGPHVDSRDAIKKHFEEARHRTRLIRAMLGIAKATGRAMILPRMLCYCDFMWKVCASPAISRLLPPSPAFSHVRLHVAGDEELPRRRRRDDAAAIRLPHGPRARHAKVL